MKKILLLNVLSTLTWLAMVAVLAHSSASLFEMTLIIVLGGLSALFHQRATLYNLIKRVNELMALLEGVFRTLSDQKSIDISSEQKND